MTPRGRWVYDEATGECVEQPLSPPKTDRELEAARKQAEQDERDAHPGTYL